MKPSLGFSMIAEMTVTPATCARSVHTGRREVLFHRHDNVRRLTSLNGKRNSADFRPAESISATNPVPLPAKMPPPSHFKTHSTKPALPAV
jgi:hypothetical protein